MLSSVCCTGMFYGMAGNKTLHLWGELLGETALIRGGPPWGGSGAWLRGIAHGRGVSGNGPAGREGTPNHREESWKLHQCHRDLAWHWDNNPWRSLVSRATLGIVLYNPAMPTAPFFEHLSCWWCEYKISLQCGRSAEKNSHAGDWEHKNFLFSLNLSVKMSDTVLSGFWTALITESWKAVLEGEIWVF